VASREKILDATAEIAGERGYEGTSISLISERSGLPASSIYWHFKDKDELIAAVIDRSFSQWIATLDEPLDAPEGSTVESLFHLVTQRTGAAIAQFPDYLRLGLMLVLERRPDEPTARAKFIEVRGIAMDRTRAGYQLMFADLPRQDVDALVQLTFAIADGLFIAKEACEVALDKAFDLLATAVLGAADQMRAARDAKPAKASQRKPAATRH
jgi:AcrR family transcriptional regulator